MSFKLIATHIISEPKFSMIVTRTLHPSYRHFKNNTVRRKLSLTSEVSCCRSLTTSGPASLSRCYSTDAQCSRVERSLDVKRHSSNLVNKYLKSLTGQAKKPGGSLKKFEPCYRPLYPSKKNVQPTYRIPRKLPYIPAVFQPRKKPVIKYQLARPTSRLHPTLVKWPPLYKSKKNAAERRSKETRLETGELPPWLLPLYSYKAERHEGMASLSEARHSGAAFRRRMEFLEGIKIIRDKQQSSTNRMKEEVTMKEVNKKPELSISKRTAAVNDLKRKIGEMYATMGTVKRSKVVRSAQLTMRKPETSEGDKSYSNEGVQLDNTSKYSVKTQSGAVKDDSLRTQGEPSTSNQQAVSKMPGFNFEGSINHRQYDPQPFISFQYSNEELGKSNYRPTSEPRAINYKLGSPSEQKGPPTIPLGTPVSENQKILKKENTVVDGNEWSVQSLKSRINEMLSNEEEKLKKITSSYKEIVEAPSPNTGGFQANVNRPSNRLFHQSVKSIVESKLKRPNTTDRGMASRSSNSHSVGNGLQLRSNYGRSYVDRKYLSTFSVSNGKKLPKTVHSICLRSHATESPAKTTNWITRIKRCFMIKRVKRVEVEDWKKTPREIPYCVKNEDTSYSPSPVLWTGEENSVKQCHQESPEFGPEELSNPAVLNAEQRIMASISRIVPTPISKFQKHSTGCTDDLVDAENMMKSSKQRDSISLQQETIGSRQSDIEQKVRKAEIKVNILPLPWLKEGRSSGNVTKLPELSSFQNDKSSSCTFTDIEKKEETGYEWIMNNKQIVEDIKYRSTQFAVKPLVPPHVKQSIEEYKLPLKAQISQYRKSIERKAHGLYLCSTARRWYSTSCYEPSFQSFCNAKGMHSLPELFQRSHIGGIGARQMSNNASSPDEIQLPRVQLRQNTSTNVLVGSEFYKKYALPPMYGDSSQDEPLNRLDRDPHATRNWANSNRAIPQRPPAPLTSPNKMLHKVADTSSPSLKKQVDDLKRLIRKSKGSEPVSEKLEDLPDPLFPGESYEMKLRRLVRAAQASAKKLKLVEPKYHTENNLRNNIPSKEKTPESGKIHKLVNPLSPHSVTNVPTNSSTFFTSLGKDSRVDSKNLKTKSQVSQSVSSDSFHTNKKKPLSSMYLRFKSFVESVRRKSTQETSASAIRPSNELKGSMSVCLLSSAERVKKEKPVKSDSASQTKNNTSSGDSVTVELRGSQVATPVSSIRLWKTEQHEKCVKASKPSMSVIEPSSCGELMSLLSRAKDLITFHSQLNIQEQTNIAKLTDKNLNNSNVATTDVVSVQILSPEEITHNLLTKAEPLKSAREVAGARTELSNFKVHENSTGFWPRLSSFPQSILDTMNQVDGREANDKHSNFGQDIKKYDSGLKSFAETMIPSSIQTTYEMCANETHPLDPHPRLADASNPAPREEPSAQVSAGTSKQFISEYSSPEASTLGNLGSTDGTTERTETVVCCRDLQSDPVILRSDDSDLRNTQNCPSGIVLQNNIHSHECQTMAPYEAGEVAEDFVPKCECTQAGGSTLHEVSSVNLETFSVNPNNDVSNVENIDQESKSEFFPTFSKEKVTCQESMTENLFATAEPDRANNVSTINQQIEHYGNNDEGNTHSSSEQSFTSSLKSSNKSHEVNEGITEISSDFAFQAPKCASNDTTAKEKDHSHVDELKSDDRSRLTELLAKDPTINPELVKKLKLPVVHPDGSNEKTWCKRY